VAAIVREVRGFAHAGEAGRQLCDLRELIESALQLATLRLEGRARIQQSHGLLPPVHGAAQDLKQVFLSLVRRAEAALAPDGCIRISSRHVGEQVEICVEDDGAVIDPERLDRIFDPPVGRDATWESDELELSICYQIVQQHGGAISIESRAGIGTRVQILLPAAGAEPVDGSCEGFAA
jgi:signal transduction histidine kinase